MRQLADSQLRRLEEHKYSCSSESLMDPLMQKWWCWLVEQCPLTLAPNLITITGLAINIFTSLILVYYSPDAKQEVPRWACFLCAFGLFVYQSLDAIDGKQARRTGTSSPLGELFDHGCDSLSTDELLPKSEKQNPEHYICAVQIFTSSEMDLTASGQRYLVSTIELPRIRI
ncbi:choline/ethanolaminephosphotransferase 1-like [Penaeus japonicus]|uniref:choline/ethanolaminephosphotransferase 1-like n=1 Tax=Penaeus japonicus TaxID=27405 RepID=UPI001C710875|nr:choline/ethanolaminephosphotransferase 1-like [Penaeus japonicus]